MNKKGPQLKYNESYCLPLNPYSEEEVNFNLILSFNFWALSKASQKGNISLINIIKDG